jgi:hypothetical protein
VAHSHPSGRLTPSIGDMRVLFAKQINAGQKSSLIFGPSATGGFAIKRFNLNSQFRLESGRFANPGPGGFRSSFSKE